MASMGAKKRLNLRRFFQKDGIVCELSPIIRPSLPNYSKGCNCVVRKQVTGHKFRGQSVERHLLKLEREGGNERPHLFAANNSFFLDMS